MKNSTAIFFISALLCLISINNASGQITDSLAFASARWETKQVKRGIIWKKTQIQSIFNSKQTINILEIDLKKHSKNLRIAAEPKKLKKTSTLAQENNAIAAINGGFFNMKSGGAVDLVRIDNQTINTTVAPSNRANAYFAFHKKQVEISADSTLIDTFPNILLSGPLLIHHKEVLNLSKNAFNDNRHPRTAIGIKKNKLYFVTVDGRNAEAQGATLNELAKILLWIGSENALNLDGGGSTTMFIKDQPDNGVVNYPCDNKIYDHLGERSVANIIYIKE